MKIDSITINVYNEDDLLNENFEIQLFQILEMMSIQMVLNCLMK